MRRCCCRASHTKHLAALAIEHRATVVTFDTDFARFPGVDWRIPA
jgi:predicted nucleic acid-binding protein